MLNTGFISFISKVSGGTQDANGNITSVINTSSIFIPCNLYEITREYKIYDEGTITYAKYSIYIDIINIPLNIDFNNTYEAEIKDKLGVNLGLYSIKSIINLAIANQLKIIL